MEMSLQKIGGITLLIFVMLIILFVSFAPGQFYDKVADLVKPFSEHVFKLMHKQKEIQRADIEIPTEIQDMFNQLKNDVEQEGKAPCLLEHKPFIKDFKKYDICFKNEINEIDLFDEKGITQLVDSKPINMKVCVVAGKKDGENVANNFLQYYIKGKQDYKDKSMFTVPREICILGLETIIFKEGLRLDDRQDLKDQNLMFKPDDEHICFFPTHDGGSKANEKGLRKDQLIAIENNIDFCKESTEPMFYNGAFYGLRSDWELKSVGGGKLYIYTGTDERVAHKFKTDGLSQYEFELLIKGPYEEFPEDKKGVYYAESLSEQGVYYGVKEDWEYVDKGFLGEKGWRYKGTEKEVPEKFKTELISKTEKYDIFGPP